jgi:hypothetical protein
MMHAINAEHAQLVLNGMEVLVQQLLLLVQLVNVTNFSMELPAKIVTKEHLLELPPVTQILNVILIEVVIYGQE